jgi:hypothetical protein
VYKHAPAPYFIVKTKYAKHFPPTKKAFLLPSPSHCCFLVKLLKHKTRKNPEKDDDEKLPEDEKRKINIPSISAAQKI